MITNRDMDSLIKYATGAWIIIGSALCPLMVLGLLLNHLGVSHETTAMIVIPITVVCTALAAIIVGRWLSKGSR